MVFYQRYLNQLEGENPNPTLLSYLAALDSLNTYHPEAARSVLNEFKDQSTHLKLIASENYSSLNVQLSMGNLLTDKYSEGVPKRRFYAGCGNVDDIESLAVEELKSLFGADHAYVQPHSGADANLVAFMAALAYKVQDPECESLGVTMGKMSDEQFKALRKKFLSQKILGLSLDSGGHLTHGYRFNISSRLFETVHYHVREEDQRIHLDDVRKLAHEHKPLIILAGYSSYPRKIDFQKMREIADEVGALLMVDMAHFAGLVAGKVFKDECDPVQWAHLVTSTTHKTLRGPRGGIVLCKEELKPYVDKGCPMVLGGPLPHVMLAKLLAFKEANTPEFQIYAQKIVDNAQALAQTLVENGVQVLTGGTENHIVAFKISGYGINGMQAEKALRLAGVTVNRNTIPNDPNGPWKTSGVRMGTPALTTLGMGSAQMQEIAQMIHNVLSNVEITGEGKEEVVGVEANILAEARECVSRLLKEFPLYPELQKVINPQAMAKPVEAI